MTLGLETKTIEIAFAINEGYVQPLCTVISSIIKNNYSCAFRFHICSSGLSGGSRRRLADICKISNLTSIHYIDFNEEWFVGIDLSIRHISIETYFRYMLPELLPELDKVLYMDADTVVDGTLTPLWEIELGNHLIAGVKDLYIETHKIQHKEKIGLNKTSLYVNAGILLMNLRQMRIDMPGKTLIELTKKYAGKVSYQDQDILNIACHNRILELDSKWNFTYDYAESNPDTVPIIIHYNGDIKPWQRGCFHPLRMVYIRNYISTNEANLNDVVEWLRPTPNRWTYSILGIPILKIKERLIKNRLVKKHYLFGFIPVLCIKEKWLNYDR